MGGRGVPSGMHGDKCLAWARRGKEEKGTLGWTQVSDSKLPSERSGSRSPTAGSSCSWFWGAEHHCCTGAQRSRAAPLLYTLPAHREGDSSVLHNHFACTLSFVESVLKASEGSYSQRSTASSPCRTSLF